MDSDELNLLNISQTVFDDDDQQEDIAFVDDPTNALKCPLCRKVFQEPTASRCGHTFCYKCLLNSVGKCPKDGSTLEVAVPNISVSEQLAELKVHCRFGMRRAQTGEFERNVNGCPEIIKLSEKREHEKNCGFAPVQCPNSAKCGFFLRVNISQHVARCARKPCPHQKWGCEFSGNDELLESHLTANCLFRPIAGILRYTDEKLERLRVDLADKNHQIEFLRSMLGTLSDKIDTLESQIQLQFDAVASKQEDGEDTFEYIKKELGILKATIPKAPGLPGLGLLKSIGTFVGHKGAVRALLVVDEYLISASADLTIKVWDTVREYKCIRTLEGHAGVVIALASAGNRLYSGGQDRKVIVWELQTWAEKGQITGIPQDIYALAASKGKVFVGSQNMIKVFDANTLQPIKELPRQKDVVRVLKVFRDSLYSGAYQDIRVWDIDSLQCLHTLELPQAGSILSIALSDPYMLCGCFYNDIYVFDLRTHQQVVKLQGHQGPVFDVLVVPSPNGHKVLSASEDHTIRAWSPDTWLRAQTVERHTESVTSLAFSNASIYSGSYDSTIKVWQFVTG